MALYNGYDVGDIQTRLKNAGFDPGNIDGIYGPKTQAAVRAYQQANGLSVDGIVGANTWGKLSSVGSPAPAPAQTNAFTPLTNPPKDFNELRAQLGNDPMANSLIAQAEVMAKKGVDNSLEQLNERNILNSSQAVNETKDINQNALLDVFPKILDYQNSQRQQRIQEALNRTQLLGYVDNESSKILGVPAGTMTAAAKQAAQELNLARSKSGGGGGGGTTKAPTQRDVRNKALSEVNNYISNGNFYRPIDLVAEMRRKYANTDPEYYQIIYDYIDKQYDGKQDKPFSTWNGGKNRYA